MTAAPPATTAALHRRAQVLAWATIAWNVVEAVVAIGSGLVAGSIALVGFGVDSTIEVFAAGVVLWRLRGLGEDRERRALRLIGVSFFALAAFVVAESVRVLLGGADPDSSTAGIVLAAASLVVMPALAVAKRRTGQRLGSAVVIADSVETELCAYLSAILLLGLVLNASVGWSWADPVAALFIAGLAAREGREAWQGEVDCC